MNSRQQAQSLGSHELYGAHKIVFHIQIICIFSNPHRKTMAKINPYDIFKLDPFIITSTIYVGAFLMMSVNFIHDYISDHNYVEDDSDGEVYVDDNDIYCKAQTLRAQKAHYINDMERLQNVLGQLYLFINDKTRGNVITISTPFDSFLKDVEVPISPFIQILDSGKLKSGADVMEALESLDSSDSDDSETSEQDFDTQRFEYSVIFAEDAHNITHTPWHLFAKAVTTISLIMIGCVKKESVSAGTLDRIDKWFAMVEILKNQQIQNHSPGILHSVREASNEYRNYLQTHKDNIRHDQTDITYDFPQFSPGALLTAIVTLINLEVIYTVKTFQGTEALSKQSVDRKKNQWQTEIGELLSKVLKYNDFYDTNVHPNMKLPFYYVGILPTERITHKHFGQRHQTTPCELWGDMLACVSKLVKAYFHNSPESSPNATEQQTIALLDKFMENMDQVVSDEKSKNRLKYYKFQSNQKRKDHKEFTPNWSPALDNLVIYFGARISTYNPNSSNKRSLGGWGKIQARAN